MNMRTRFMYSFRSYKMFCFYCLFITSVLIFIAVESIYIFAVGLLKSAILSILLINLKKIKYEQRK
jgi:hypothetical protein